MPQVCVVYRETHAGKTALSCARDFARLFSDTDLRIYLAENAAVAPRMDECGAFDYQLCQHSQVSWAVHERGSSVGTMVVPFNENTLPEYPDGSVVVEQEFGKAGSNVHYLCPGHETSLDGRHVGPILVPFSDGESGLVAGKMAIELALRWRKFRLLPEGTPEVIFYHTTWADPARANQPAQDQMCNAATKAMLSLMQAAEQDISHQVIVETHDDVVQGVIDTALSNGVTLIVMARGPEIRQGSYVERTTRQCPVPVFVTGTKTVPLPFVSDDEVRRYRQSRQALAKESGRQTTSLKKRFDIASWLLNPVVVQLVAAAMYLLKSCLKIGVGVWIASPMITGDGFHNIADLVQAVAVAVVIVIARRPATERYPYGRMNMEWFGTLAIGLLLFVAAAKFVGDCVAGLLTCFPDADALVRSVIPFLPVSEASQLDSSSFWWVLAVTGSSFLLSRLVGAYQVRVGRTTNHKIMVADGEETLSDGWIELATVVGVIAQYVTGWRAIEYPLGLLIAYMIMRTASELVMSGWRVLLQHSLDGEHEEAIMSHALSVAGVAVDGSHELKTFQVGHTAVVMLTVETLAGKRAMSYIKKAVELAVRNYLLSPQAGFSAADIHVKMQRPNPHRRRVGYALIIKDQNACIAPTLAMATHIAVSDVEHGDVVRTKVLPLADDPLAMLLDKRIQKLYTFRPTKAQRKALRHDAEQRLAEFGDSDIVPIPQLSGSTCYTLSPLGLSI